MCGPLATLATSSPSSRSQWRRLMAAYHFSRLMGYAFVGALAGALGAALDLSGILLGIQRSAALLAGGGMIVIGSLALARFLGGQAFHFTLPVPVNDLLKRRTDD